MKREFREMNKAQRYGIIGMVIGLVSEVTNSQSLGKSLNIIGAVIAMAITGGLGYGIGQWRDGKTRK
jgi:hypothetical protein